MCQPLIRSLFLSRREMALKFCRFPWIKHAISWCPAKTVCWVASIFFCHLASRTPHTFSTSLWKCKSMVAKSLNSMERYMPSTACPWLLRCAAPDKSFSIGGQVGSGQVRSGLHASGEPVLGRRRKKHNMCTTAIYMWQKLSNETKCEFHTTSSSTSLHDPRFVYLQYAWS